MSTSVLETPLLPRKRPRQSRSAVTVDAMLEAAVRILLAEGYPRLTTRRVAEVAGVSVGSLYQYFPNRAALVAELVRRRVEAGVGSIERAAAVAEGSPREALIAVMRAFAEEKRAGLRVSIALQEAKATVEGRRMMMDGARRAAAIIAALLERLAGRPLGPVERSRLGIALAAVEGAVAATAEENPTAFADPGYEDMLARILLAALDLG